jgi:hypothetical protein
VINRRKVLAIGAASLLASICDAFAQTKAKRLVLIHGRGQQGLDPTNLQSDWLKTLRLGAQAAGKSFPDQIEVAFPYYGDTLEKFRRSYDIPLTSEVQTRGGRVDDEFLVFQAEVAESLRQRAGISDAQVDIEYGSNPKPKGPLNWQWVQAILRTLDKYGGGMSQTTLEVFTRDVFLYTTRIGVREEIDQIVSAAFTEEPTVVVGHSLGSAVGYSVLRSDRRALHIPLYVTVGCPLGVRPIRDQFRPLKFPKPVDIWYNAFDTRDAVALYPLDKDNFPVSPAIQNFSSVNNHTDNRHGIIGYLDDATVAAKVISALGS